MPFTAFAATLADLVLPRCCVGCGRAGPTLCASCTPAGLLRYDAAGLPVVAAGEYGAALRTALIAYKERGRRDLAAVLAGLLGRAVADGPAGVLVPVPCPPRVARTRGGDHVLRLARIVARGNACTVATPLRLVRPVQDSAGLSLRARAANLHGAMAATAPPLVGTAAVVVDDIVTTAATLHEAARALTVAGWSVSGGAAVAATARRGSALARPGRAV
ncbi:MAG: amidophosphoribosyltransferase [Pseudonocardiales bacterium]|nr:MAG: amidophosphoribosyltransferase [Pseudonocardiales bacterium]